MRLRDDFIDRLALNGWKIGGKSKNIELADPKFLARFNLKDLNSYSYFDMLKLEYCVANNDMAWFLTYHDYNRTSDSEFSWDEFEKIIIENLNDSADKDYKRDVSNFWSGVLPIFTSLKSGYEYLGIITKGEKRKCIIHGFEPSFEEFSVISADFDSFMKLYLQDDLDEYFMRLINGA